MADTSLVQESLRFDSTDVPTELEIKAVQHLVSADLRDQFHLSVDSTGLLVNSEGKIFVPEGRLLRLRLFICAHQGIGAHAGVDVTLAWLQAKFWWPHMDVETRRLVAACSHCLKVKGGRVVPRPLLESRRAASPNEILHFDYSYVREASEGTPGGAKWVLVLMDGFSRFVELIPTEKDDAETAITALMDWFKRFGVVKYWVSDRGTHFTALVMDALRKQLGAQHHFTAVYAAWSNGRIERVNRKLREMLSAMMLESGMPPEKWPQVLPLVNAALNATPTESLAGHSPMKVFTGRDPGTPLDVVFKPEGPAVVKATDVRVRCQEHVQALAEELQGVCKQVVEVPARKAPRLAAEKPVDFGVGDFVLVARPDAKLKDKTKPLWRGPAVVTALVNDGVFSVKDIVTGQVRDMHIRFLKRYADSSLTLTDEVKDLAALGDDGFTIDHIQDHTWEGDVLKLLVCWEGFEDGDPSWEVAQRLFEDAPTIVKKYVKTILPESERIRVLTALRMTKEKAAKQPRKAHGRSRK